MPMRTEGYAPVRKVTAGGIAGAVTAVLVFVVNTYVSPHKPLPAEIAAAITTIISFVVAYLIRPAASDTVITA